jgi:hypothetical protein
LEPPAMYRMSPTRSRPSSMYGSSTCRGSCTGDSAPRPSVALAPPPFSGTYRSSGRGPGLRCCHRVRASDCERPAAGARATERRAAGRHSQP